MHVFYHIVTSDQIVETMFLTLSSKVQMKTLFVFD